MIEVAALQILSKVLLTKNISIIEDNFLTEEYFPEYLDEYNYIMEHYRKYGNVPDKATFLSNFPDVELVEVTESDEYLVDTICEEWTFNKSVPVLKNAAKMMKTDANEAVRYMLQAVKDLQPKQSISAVDIVSQAMQRYNDYIERRDHKDEWTFTTGFPELDDLIHGIERVEELIVVFARINNGKSFVAEKICTHVWQLGFNIGYISPEMSPNSIGYRFDTLYKGFSNKGLMWANNTVDAEQYREYIEELSSRKNKFKVATPLDFDKKITVGKLKQWVEQNNLHMLAIDGITYLTDERGKRGDTKTATLTNISEDLMSLSIELKIPILVVVQANRSGVVQDTQEEDGGTPDLENIKDSDGIAANASKVLSLRHTKEGVLKIGIKKQRFGPVGGHINYQWNPDIGEFKFIRTDDDIVQEEPTEKRQRKRPKMETDEDMF
jgi:replicative DNA helicase